MTTSLNDSIKKTVLKMYYYRKSNYLLLNDFHLWEPKKS